MSVTAGALLGIALGTGLLMLARGLWPQPPSLAAQLAALGAANPSRASSPRSADDRAARWERIVGPQLARACADLSWLPAPLPADLAITRTSTATFYATKAAGGLVGLLLPAAAVLTAAAAGHTLPLLVPAWIALTGAVVGFTLPDLRIKSRAAAVRRSYRTALGAYLDLVAMRMASGAGLAEALHDAANLASGPLFGELRSALADARTDGLSPTDALRRLGTELDLPDLTDTASRLSLVDTSGAQAETSLRAQAATLRDRELSDTHGTANERTQSMLVAQVVLAMGFLLFLGYPAVVKVLSA
jgi:Flp pilus assembly protein TadB